MKLLYISGVPARYQLELFEGILDQGLAEVRALFSTWSYPGLWESRPTLREGFEVLPRLRMKRFYPDLIFNYGIEPRVRAFEPDIAIVGGHHIPGLHRAMTILTRLGLPWLFWEEIVQIPTNPLKRFIRTRLLDGAVRRCHSILAVGSQAKTFFEEWNSGGKTVHNFPYASDLGRFTNQPRPDITNGRIRFLYCGQFIHRKGVDLLIEAFARIAPRFEQAELVLLGSGPLQDELERQVPESLRSRVRFEGHVPWGDLPRHYAEADVFAFPSRHDGWGMVIPEAMAAGLAIISTDAVGSALDLIEEGKTGHVIENENVDQLAKCLGHFCEQPEQAAIMGAQARETSQRVDISRAAPHLIRILEEALQ